MTQAIELRTNRPEAARCPVAEAETLSQEFKGDEMLAEWGLYTSKVIHEIANHLNGMSTCVQLLKREMKFRADYEPTTNTIDDLLSEIGDLQNLLQELREINRPLKLYCLPVGLATLAARVLDKIFPAPVRHGVQVRKDFSENLRPVMADPKKLEQVLINLIKNAGEAMPDGGYLTLRGYPEGNHVCFEVEDTGVGIPKDIRVFHPFATSKPEGTGLGLCIVHEIITGHHGTIEYVSTVGSGTTFKISLPAAEQSEN